MNERVTQVLAMMGAVVATSTPSGGQGAPASGDSTAPVAATSGSSRPIEVQGHRGARAARPENTLAAFGHALEVGVDVIELDLVVTRDDRLAVVHDLQLNPDLCLGPDGRPPADRPPVRSLTLEELKRYDCGTLRNGRFPDQVPVPGQRIPAFEEVLALVRDSVLPAARTVRLNVEIKTLPGRPDLGPPPARLAELVVAAVRTAGLPGRIGIQSFDHRIVRAVHDLDPAILLSALVGDGHPADLVAVVRAAGASVLTPNHEWITADDVRVLHQSGIRVVPWTANGVGAWERLLDLGVDGIITDDPAGLIAHLRMKGRR